MSVFKVITWLISHYFPIPSFIYLYYKTYFHIIYFFNIFQNLLFTNKLYKTYIYKIIHKNERRFAISLYYTDKQRKNFFKRLFRYWIPKFIGWGKKKILFELNFFKLKVYKKYNLYWWCSNVFLEIYGKYVFITSYLLSYIQPYYQEFIDNEGIIKYYMDELAEILDDWLQIHSYDKEGDELSFWAAGLHYHWTLLYTEILEFFEK